MIKEVKPALHIRGTLQPPPDKSILHRSVMFAALHDGPSVIRNFSEAEDPGRTVQCMRQLGVKIERDGNRLTVEGVGRQGLMEPERDLDCGNSGTTMRLLSGIIAGSGKSARLAGDSSLSSRTMRRIIEPLSEMGADVEAREGDYAPLDIRRPGDLVPIRFKLPIPSAQLKSCVLLAGLFGDEPTRVIETVQSRDHTERLLELDVLDEGDYRIIESSLYDDIPSQTYRIPGDFSAASFWLIAAAVHPDAEVRIRQAGLNPTRSAALDILQQMGANLSVEEKKMEGPEPVADLKVSSSTLKPVHITGDRVPNCIDELPILAVSMLYADGISRISGAGELRHKETDRLNALSEMLEAVGAEFKEHKDGLEIYGNPDFRPEAAELNSYNDHRIAMTAAVLALNGSGTFQIHDADCVDISYPSFWKDLSDLTN